MDPLDSGKMGKARRGSGGGGVVEEEEVKCFKGAVSVFVASIYQM